MNVNTNFEVLYQDPSKLRYDRYWLEYREKWHKNPTEFIVGDFPLFLDIEATSICNLRCPHCIQTRAGFPRGFIEMDLYKKIVDEASEKGCYGCKYHAVGRGEPLLNRNIVRMVAYAKKRGFIDTYLNTNGIRLTKNFSKALLDAGLDRICFSIDGYDLESYHRVRPGADLRKLTRTVEEFHNIRERWNYSTFIRIQTVALEGLNLQVYASVWKDCCDEVGAVKYKNMVEREFGLKGNWICPQPWQRMAVLYDGTILPCNHDDRLFSSLGNAEDMSLGKAWHGEGMKFVREVQSSRRGHLLSSCDGCYLRTSEMI